jgi:hypothetical protein
MRAEGRTFSIKCRAFRTQDTTGEARAYQHRTCLGCMQVICPARDVLLMLLHRCWSPVELLPSQQPGAWLPCWVNLWAALWATE